MLTLSDKLHTSLKCERFLHMRLTFERSFCVSFQVVSDFANFNVDDPSVSVCVCVCVCVSFTSDSS